MPLTRRQSLQALGATVATAALPGCDQQRPSSAAAGANPTAASASAAPANASAAGNAAKPSPVSSGSPSTNASRRMPAVYLPHGGGPWPFMDLDRLGLAGAYEQMERYMRALSMTPPQTPKALLLVSAHWEESVPTVMSAATPPMLYDYYNFPPETYTIEWPAPGAPELAAQTRELLEAAGIASGDDRARGFDHGTFVPMMLSYPQADIPTFQLSLQKGLDPRQHLAIGRALAPLRDEGVFIIGSGMSYHNMGGFFGRVPTVTDDSHAFDDWLVESCTAEADTRDTRLAEWARAPRARACHPREEHLLPLMVIAGAAGDDPASVPYRDVVMKAHVSAIHFG